MGLDREAFFQSLDARGESVTYADVLVRPGMSDVRTAEVDIASQLTTNIELGTPILSAAMDTVTESQMAIAMAKMGGIGVLHAGLSPKEQGKEARRVKHELNGVVYEPITVRDTSSLGDVLEHCEKKGFDFRTFPVVDKKGKFVGLLTQNDFDFELGDMNVRVGDAMTPAAEIVTGKKDMSPEDAFSRMKEHKKKTLPLIHKGEVVGMYVLSDVMRQLQGNPDRYSLDQAGRLLVAAAVPTDEGALERIEAMTDYLDVVVIDSARGDSKDSFNTLRLIKQSHPDLDVVVGNITNPDSARALVDAGADGIKVGQGPGSICTTRVETGIGVPQITAVYECVEAIKGSGVPVCADGGIVEHGDISKAIAAGASSVMIGSKLAGTREAPGQVLMIDGVRVKQYRGMGSASAMKASAAARRRYGQDGAKGNLFTEGVESVVPVTGSVVEVLDLFIGGLRAGMAYAGSPNIEHHRTRAVFTRISGAGLTESRPHDVAVIQSQ